MTGGSGHRDNQRPAQPAQTGSRPSSGPQAAGAFDPALPINARRDEIIDLLRRHRAVIVCGATGSGKTTQLPRMILDSGLADLGGAGRGMIAHTQPRRLAARSVAARIAHEMGVPLGGSGPVGVKVRFTDETSTRTRIKLMTDGLLLAELAADPMLRAYSVVIIDEAHERSLNVDFLLGILRGLLERRDDLRVVITSATIDPRRFAAYFARDGVPAPVVEVSGRMYPVEVRYRPPSSARSGSGREGEPEPVEVDPTAVADAVEELLSPRLPRGDVLVFLPGEREIRQCAEAVRRAGVEAEVLPMLARLSNEEQDRVFRPAAGGRRRVVLATNVAETSLTVPGIRYVVDTGLVRTARYDAGSKVRRLPVEPVSQASADQRSGRCGRVAEGVCIRLYSEESFGCRPRFTDPEIRRTDLASVMLRLYALGLGEAERFPFIEPPEAGQLRDGHETLVELHAIDRPGGVAGTGPWRVTEVGRAMSGLPLEPRVARMLVAAAWDGPECLEAVLVLAAGLSVQDPRDRPLGRQEEADRAQTVFRDETSDFLTLLNVWSQYWHAAAEARDGDGPALEDWCRRHFINGRRMREWAEVWEQLRELAADLPGRAGAPAGEPAPQAGGASRPLADAIHRAMLTGLISNVCCRDDAHGPMSYRAFKSPEVALHPGSVLFRKAPRWVMAAELVRTTRLFARCVARIEPEWVVELAAHVMDRKVLDAHFDQDAGEACAWERLTLAGVVVVPRRRVPLAQVDPARARGLLLEEGVAGAALRCPAGSEHAPGWRWAASNAATLEAARGLEARVRRRGVLRAPSEVARVLEGRVPSGVVGAASLAAWIGQDPGAAEAALTLTLADVADARAAGTIAPGAFPEAIELAGESGPVRCPITFAWSPGRDDDGITVEVPLSALPALGRARAEWLVPGALPAKVLAMFKSLPRADREALERAAGQTRGQSSAQGAGSGMESLAEEVAGLMAFGEGELPAALAEAVEVVASVTVSAGALGATLAGLPEHHRLRVRVVDGQEHVATSRDVVSLSSRLAARVARAAAESARLRFERSGITAWDFGELPERVSVQRGGETAEAYPALADAGDSVRLTLADSPMQAAALTATGLRRLFALACGEELAHRIEALADWPAMKREHAALGPEAELRDGLVLLIAQRAFVLGQPPVRDPAAFTARLQDQWGRLGQLTFETASTVAGTLGPRALVAKRLSGGTPRLWAASVADLREQAAYLFPPGFLSALGWERVRELPRYSSGMWQRLGQLREDGSGSESAALAAMAPHWKRFTGWVSRRMSAESARAQAEGRSAEQPAVPRGGKAPLPQARRAAPRVNLDAGAWAASPGAMPPEVEAYRWAAEELRLALFVPELSRPAGPGPAGGWAARCDELWRRVEALGALGAGRASGGA